MSNRRDLPSTFQPTQLSQIMTSLPTLFNTLNIRRAILPAANGHCSARALARYYATLVDGGMVPAKDNPPSSSSLPPLGSHSHIPKFPSKDVTKKKVEYRNCLRSRFIRSSCSNEPTLDSFKSNGGDYGRTPPSDSYTRVPSNDYHGQSNSSINTTNNSQIGGKIFANPKIHDAFLGAGDYENLVLPNGNFGLGFKRVMSKDGHIIGFGHAGMGGSTGFCNINNRFAIAVTVNKMSFGGVTGKIVQFVCSELNMPVPEEYLRFGAGGTDLELNLERPLIN